MVAAFGLLHQLPAHSEKPLVPPKHVAFMVKRPCCCICTTFITAIVMSSVGIGIVFSNAGPLGPFKLGMDYASERS